MSVKFSIITAVFNAENLLGELLESILSQTFNDYEIILIDGDSKDNTVQVIKKYENNVAYWVSEPDKGIYDAWNKGVMQATGEWIMFLGADDKLLPDALESYAGFLDQYEGQDKPLYISSRMEILDLNKKLIRVKGWPWEWPFFLKEMTVAHPGSIHSRRLFDTYGLFDISYRSSGDYELLLRPRQMLRGAFLNKITVKMQEGGMSDSALGIEEHCRAAIHTGGCSPIAAYSNALWVYAKFKGKKMFRRMGINAYLKKDTL